MKQKTILIKKGKVAGLLGNPEKFYGTEKKKSIWDKLEVRKI